MFRGCLWSGFRLRWCTSRCPALGRFRVLASWKNGRGETAASVFLSALCSLTGPLEHERQGAAALLPHARDLRVVVVHLSVKSASEVLNCEVQIRLFVSDGVDRRSCDALVWAVQAS